MDQLWIGCRQERETHASRLFDATEKRQMTIALSLLCIPSREEQARFHCVGSISTTKACILGMLLALSMVPSIVVTSTLSSRLAHLSFPFETFQRRISQSHANTTIGVKPQTTETEAEIPVVASQLARLVANALKTKSHWSKTSKPDRIDHKKLTPKISASVVNCA